MKTTFRPSTDGFAFDNTWFFKPQEKDLIWSLYGGAVLGATAGVFGIFPAIPLDPVLMGTVTAAIKSLVDDQLKKDFGLCGGMAYAACDYYMANQVIPRGFSDGQPDYDTPQGATLRGYIWQRLADSFTGGNVALTTLEWMAILLFVPKELSGGAPWLLGKTKDEWTKLKQHLDEGTPWPLGYIGTTQNPMDNHQVLAYGYEDNGNGTGRIYVYDSNCPDQESTIDLDFTGQTLSAQESCGSFDRGPLQGFFCSSYQPNSSPPAAVGTTQSANITSSSPGQGRGVTVSYTAANVGFGRSLPLQLYVRGVGEIPVRGGNGDGGGSGGALKPESGPGGPPLHTTQIIHFTSSAEASNPLTPIESLVSDLSPHGAAPDNAITRQLTSAESPTLQDGSWSFFPEVYFGNVDGVDIYKLLPIVQKPKEGKESKEGKDGKDGKEKEKEAVKDRKDNKETAKEKEQDLTGFAGSMPVSGMKGVAFSGQEGNGEAPRATGQAFIRPEERPDVGRRTLQQPANE